MIRQLIKSLLSILLALSCTSCAPETKTVTIRILATSDLHGKMLPWNYLLNEADDSGSAAQLSSAVHELRDDNTILIDAGDTIQDNSAELFKDEPVHPMIQCLNQIGYDIWVPGNHEFDYGMDYVTNMIPAIRAKTLVNNIYTPAGDRMADAWTVIEIGGVRIGVIGMTTPVIADFERIRESGYTVSDPVSETKQAIQEMEGMYDVLIAVCHMGIGNSISAADTSVLEVAEACPELDVIIAAHEHNAVNTETENGILLVENQAMAGTLADISLEFKKEGNSLTLLSKQAELVNLQEYAPDPEIESLMADYDKQAKEDSETVIGTAYRSEDCGFDEADVPAYDPAGNLSREMVCDTPLMDLVQQMMLHYSGAQISAAPISSITLSEPEGDITKSQAVNIIRYSNILCLLEMNGSQLKKFMEWSASYFAPLTSETDVIQSNGERLYFYYDLFEGVDYEIDLTKPAYERITNLTYQGKPVQPDDIFTVASTNFRTDNLLLKEDGLFAGEEKPRLLNNGVGLEIGTLKELMVDYLQNVLHGDIALQTDNNWRILPYPSDH